MSKTKVIIGFTCFLTISILVIPSKAYAAQYYDQYLGIAFMPGNKSASYNKITDGQIFHNDTNDEVYYCPVTFNVRDGSTHFIKSIGIRYKDNLTNGEFSINLERLNLYNGAHHTVATWTSGVSNASSSIQTASQGTIAGYKLVDTRKFAYFLWINFWVDGAVNPSNNLILYQVRIHYGT